MVKKKERDKENDQARDSGKDLSKKPGSSAKKGATVGASSYKLPEPDRIQHVSCPAVLPPAVAADEAAEEEGDHTFAYEEDGLPRKLQLAHLTLLQHPVYIGAVDGLLMEDECQQWIAWGEKLGFEEAKQRQTAEMAFRDNGRIEIESEDVAHLLWLRIRPFVPEVLLPPSGGSRASGGRRALGCSPRIRLYRYTNGQRFGQHVDGSRDEPSLGGRTHFTVLVYLNGGDRDTPEARVRGGETVFWKDRGGNPTTVALSFPPTRGVCLFHGHGDECMIHEGAPVENGQKYVLRTDVVYEHEA